MQNYIYWATDETESIEHFGILGQKWGVRRYQNEDGTLTEAGRKHYKLDKYARNDGYRVTKRLPQYEDAVKAYNNAEVAYMNNRNSKNAKARDEAYREYKHVKKLMKDAKNADEGEALYKKGRTISGNEKTIGVVTGGVVAAGGGVAGIAGAMNARGIKNIKLNTSMGDINIPTATVASIGAALGASSGILGIGLGALTKSTDNKLRAYNTYRIKEK